MSVEGGREGVLETEEETTAVLTPRSGRERSDAGTAADLQPETPRAPRKWAVDWRLMGIAIVTEVMAVFLAYMTVNVPLVGPKLTRDEALEHRSMAIIGALVVAAGVFLVVRETLRARRLNPAVEVDMDAVAPGPLPRIPRALRFERVPEVWVAVAAAVSVATIVPSIVFGAPLWLAWLAILGPWVPIVALEARSKFLRDSLFAGFGLLVILQLLHMVEHSAQVTQLWITNGALADAHGIIGELDFELVHFLTDTMLWISLGLLVIIFRGRNIWLCVAFAAASLHQVEHFYLFWLFHADNDLYLSGGAAGIMGKNGLIGSPLERPYLHYTYNLIVFVPMLIALWDEARRVDRDRDAKDLASMPNPSTASHSQVTS